MPDEAARRQFLAYYHGLFHGPVAREQNRVWLASWFRHYRMRLVRVLQERVKQCKSD
jgi:hypothetical protein